MLATFCHYLQSWKVNAEAFKCWLVLKSLINFHWHHKMICKYADLCGFLRCYHSQVLQPSQLAFLLPKSKSFCSCIGNVISCIGQFYMQFLHFVLPCSMDSEDSQRCTISNDLIKEYWVVTITCSLYQWTNELGCDRPSISWKGAFSWGERYIFEN